VGWVGQRLSIKWNVPWVLEVCDLWPDFPIQMGALPRPTHTPLRALERRLYASASRIVTLSPDMTEHVEAQGFGGKAETSYGGTASPKVAPSAPWKARVDAKKRLLYAGTLGRANAIPLLLSAAEQLAGRDDHEFVFLGSGFHEPDVRRAADRLPNVRFMGTVPRRETHRWFAEADLSLVPFLPLPVLRANSPSKLYDSLGAGTPVLVTNSGWTRDLVERHGLGWYASSDDAAGFARTVEALLDNPAQLREAAVRTRTFSHDPRHALLFDRDAQAEQYLDLFTDVLGEPRSGSGIARRAA
jgi:glycosyltransferase involved in cell wall biosynthesis